MKRHSACEKYDGEKSELLCFAGAPATFDAEENAAAGKRR